MKFSEKLQKLRKDNNLSQEQLADKLDVSRQSVSKWESGQTYPEMDKLLTMCKIFNITLDDLTNDEIKYNDVRTKNTNALSNLIDDLVYIIDKSFSMFRNMPSKIRGKVIGELIVLFIILLLFRIPFAYIESLGYTLGYNLPRGGTTFTSLWSFIINTIYLVLFIFTYLYIYKTHYLDKYKETKISQDDEPINKTLNTTIAKTQENIEVKVSQEKDKPKEKYRKSSNFGETLFTALGKVSSLCIKGFLAFLLIPFIITLISLFLCGTIMFGLIFKGIIYFGIILLIIAGAIINVILVKAIISFIFNLKVNARILLILFLTSLGLVGIGSGITVIEFASTEFIDEAPNSKYELTTKTFEYQIDDKLVFRTYYQEPKIKIDENLQDTVKIEVTYYEDLMKIQPFENNDYNFNSIEIWTNTMWDKKIIELILDNLKEKKIYNYEQFYDYEITIYTSTNNLERLKNNYANYEKAINETTEYYYNSEVAKLETEIDNLNSKIYSLENKIEELNNNNEILKDENNELKEKLQEYKNNIQNLLD